VSNSYQNRDRRAQPDPLPGKVTVPEQVVVSMAEIAGAAREGLLALGRGHRPAGHGRHVRRGRRPAVRAGGQAQR
jgi:hypothetical protein